MGSQRVGHVWATELNWTVVQCQAFDGPASLLFSCRCWMLACGWREKLCSTHYGWLSSIALLPWLPGFPPQAFPTTISSITSLRSVSHTQQQPTPWDCSTILKFQLPATVPSRGPASLSEVCMAAARIIWFSFHLGYHRSSVSLSALNVSPLSQTNALMWRSDHCFNSPPTKGKSSPTNTPVFPPSSFILVSFVWFYIFFSTGQVLLSALSWCSACTSVSEGLSLMYPWRKTYSTSICSSALLFSSTSLLFTRCPFVCRDPIQATTLPLAVMSPYFHLDDDRFSHFSCFWCPWKFWGVQFEYFAEYLSIRSDLSSHDQRKEGEEHHRNK